MLLRRCCRALYTVTCGADELSVCSLRCGASLCNVGHAVSCMRLPTHEQTSLTHNWLMCRRVLPSKVTLPACTHLPYLCSTLRLLEMEKSVHKVSRGLIRYFKHCWRLAVLCRLQTTWRTESQRRRVWSLSDYFISHTCIFKMFISKQQ